MHFTSNAGATFRFGPNLHEDLTKMAETYGDVFSLKMGNRLVVVLSSSDAVREAMISKPVAFAGRPDFYSFAAINEEGAAISLTTYGPQFRLLRKITQSAIHKFAFRNGDVLDGKLRKECERLISHFQANQRMPFDPRMVLRASAANVILGALFGVDRNYDDEDLRRILGLSDNFRTTIGSGIAVDFMPWLSLFPCAQLTKLRHLIDLTKVWMERWALSNKKHYTAGKIRNIADSFTRVVEEETMKRRRPEVNNNEFPPAVDGDHVGSGFGDHSKEYSFGDEDNSDKGKFSEADVGALKPLLSDSAMQRVLMDIFGAGFDTTHITLHWSLAYLIKHPSIQRAVQRELDAVIGRERLPTSQDLERLPLLKATVYEILRVTSIAPLALPHSTLSDTRLAGYDIPQGTVVFVNLWSLHRSGRYWHEPGKFDPYRFIDEQGRLRDVKSLPGFLPFGSGRRQCPGRAFAFLEVCIFLAALLQRFRFSQEELEAKYQGVSFQGQPGLTLSAETFYVHLETRGDHQPHPDPDGERRL